MVKEFDGVQLICLIWIQVKFCYKTYIIPCFPTIFFSSVCDAGLVQYREGLPVKVIVGACVGGGLFLIILVCASIVVLCRRKVSNQNHQQQALPQPQLQPRQQHRTHENVRNVTEEGYINDHLAPNDEIPFPPWKIMGKTLKQHHPEEFPWTKWQAMSIM